MAIYLTGRILPTGNINFSRTFSPPTVSASFSPNPVTAGVQTTLSWTSTDTNYVIISGYEPTQYPANGSLGITYNTAGTQTITVTAVGNGGSTSTSPTVLVNEAPTTAMGITLNGGPLTNTFINLYSDTVLPITLTAG